MTTHSKQPLSPHLQIYRLPLTAILSVVHRGTGVVLGLGSLLLVWVLAAAAQGPAAYEPVYQQLSSWYGQIFLFGLSFALYLHFCNGIRHLFWDVGMGFELETADMTAKLVFVAATLLTIATWLVAYSAG
jgi:succinate dehydrogenase / fumarate reductase cytochrome b subunit